MDSGWWTDPSELDEDQQAIINDLSTEEDHLIAGPPGSGKTNLLILRATYLHLNGKHNLAIITYNRTLKEFLSSGVRHYDFASEKIQTYLHWCIGVIQENGESFTSSSGSFQEQQKDATEKVKKLIAEKGAIDRYDCLLIDEAQDYTSEEIDIFRSLGKRIFAVGDDQQQIYDEKDGIDQLKNYCKEAPPLKYHYRNGRKICRVADSIRNNLDSPNGLESTSQYDETSNPSSVESVQSDTIEEQAEKIIAQLETQLLAYPGELIGVACPRHRELEAVWEVIRNSPLANSAQLQTFKTGYSQLDPEKKIYVTTLHGTKGMEFRALHIAGAEQVRKFKAKQKRLIYTGVTRAKTSLTLHHSGSLPGYIENAVSSVERVPVKPSLNDLFKAGS